MSRVVVRQYVCSKGLDHQGRPCIADIEFKAREVIDVRLAAAVRVNALAVMARPGVRYRVLRHELRLLLSYLDDPRGRPLRLRRREFAGSALHIRRFVSESFGLAMLTSVAEWAFGWRARRRAVAHFDALPTSLAPGFATTGIRPDLLFRLPTGPIAGEARGRSQRAPREPTSRQRRRLDDLARWSAAQGDHPFLMTWASATESGTVVDLFQVDERPSQAKLRRDDAYAERATSFVENTVSQLFQDAPPGSEEQRLFDRRVHGGWVPLDLVDRPEMQLMVGILEAPIDVDTEESVAGAIDRPRPEELDVDLTGSLLLALGPSRDGAPPRWEEVRRSFE